jgi:hypothetical protein
VLNSHNRVTLYIRYFRHSDMPGLSLFAIGRRKYCHKADKPPSLPDLREVRKRRIASPHVRTDAGHYRGRRERPTRAHAHLAFSLAMSLAFSLAFSEKPKQQQDLSRPSGRIV